eukprot:TRINITY_DN23428_c0_g1_i1.p1 TRINITY_DN23428_c0_g1~~TRINITY_DN23428_c0_g1_i1.p1  ORF type:complete len:776 (-),score=73.66 TRINITY_DN23428_c0_g1_i1:118-2445(-)
MQRTSTWGDTICDTLGTTQLEKQIHRTALANAKAELSSHPSNPCILERGSISDWSAASTWTFSSLGRKFADSHVRIGLQPGGQPKNMRLKDFIGYMRRDSDGDLEPNYVFEPRIRSPLLSEFDSTLGGLFPNDYMSCLGENTRPPFRWLCLGPRRSGSRVHIDPLATSAWNALLQGRKRWVLIDPRAVGSGLTQADIQKCNLSPVEWFADVLPKLRSKCPQYVLEAVQEVGEVMYVPSGVWHAVLNLTDTIALTQNFVGPAEFEKSWKLVCRERPGLAREWLEQLRIHEPSLARRVGAFGHSTPLPSDTTPTHPINQPQSKGMNHMILDICSQRLAGARRPAVPELAPTWSASAHWRSTGGRSRWIASRASRRGEVVFVCSAIQSVYDDEVDNGDCLVALAGKMQQDRDFFSRWGMKSDIAPDEFFRTFRHAAQPIWSLKGRSRIGGVAMFPFSGTLKHSAMPSLVFTFVGDACIAVAARDLEPGDELTACMSLWRFSEKIRLADSMRAGIDDIEWPEHILPSQDNTQMRALLSFFEQVEEAAWGDNESAQQAAVENVKAWLTEFSGLKILQTYPYLLLRVHALAVHLCMGMHRLDDAWDSASQLIELLSHAPLSDAGEICVSLAILGGALAHQQRQPDRARQLFRKAARYLSESLGCTEHSDVWSIWLGTFVPSPLLEEALAAWQGSESSTTLGLPGLGTLESIDAGGAAFANNVEFWNESSHPVDSPPNEVIEYPEASSGHKSASEESAFSAHEGYVGGREGAAACVALDELD